MAREDPARKEAVTFRIARDVLALLRAEAMDEGQNKDSGRVYNPSATLDRILRQHYADKLKRRTK
ncbi:MAG: hypothetical protein JWM87_702 [Candidatus Eremiobacteraeota bacterium]|nr:hypothetical protein [Candidatus Eremiobacteraeota bacterium]